MTVSPAVRAAAALELRRRQADGNGVAVIIQDGELWRYRGQWLTKFEADAMRKTFRGTLIVVNRSPAPLPANTADASFPVSARPTQSNRP